MLLPVTLAQVTPHGSEYVGAYLCPLPTPAESDDVACTTSCSREVGCDVDSMQCCPTTPGCRDCTEAVATDAGHCEDEDGNESITPLATFLNEDDCEFWQVIYSATVMRQLEGTWT